MPRNSKWRSWTPSDVRTLKTLSRKKTRAGSIARTLKRTEGATRQKAFSQPLRPHSAPLPRPELSPWKSSAPGLASGRRGYRGVECWANHRAPARIDGRPKPGAHGQLRADIGNRFGLYQVRGRYVPEPGAEPLEENAFLLFGSTDDSGNLKGFLRKFGRKFGQEAVIWKGYYRDVLLFALKDLPALSLANGEIKNLGRFQANVIGQYHALLARGVRGAAGQWAGLGIWTQPSFFNRVSGLCCLTSNGPE